MRHLKKNKQTLYYALYKGKETIYKLDKNGAKIVSYVDDTVEPAITYYEKLGVADVYDKYVKFEGNIALSGGDSQTVDFGVSVADYEAVLIMGKDALPITETSLIWFNTKPSLDVNGYTDASTADFRVAKVSPMLNETRYILSKVVK